MVVFEDTPRAGNRINDSCRQARAESSRWRTDRPGRACRTVGHIEKEIAFFDCPSVIAGPDDPVDLLDIVLADISFNEVARNRIERKAIRVAQAVGVYFRHLTGALERIVCGNAVLSVAAERIVAGGVKARVEWIEAQHFTKRHAEVLRVAPRRDVAGTDVIGVAAIAQSQVHVAVGSKGAGAAVMVLSIFAEGDDLAQGRRINGTGVSAGDLPFV